MLSNSSLTFPYKNKNYQLANLRLKQWGQFCDWVAFYNYHRAKAQNVDNAPLQELLQTALDTKLAVDSPEVCAKIFTADGIAQLIIYSLRLGNPNITEAELEDIMEAQPFVDEIPSFADRFLSLIGIVIPKNETTPNPAEAEKSL